MLFADIKEEGREGGGLERPDTDDQTQELAELRGHDTLV